MFNWKNVKKELKINVYLEIIVILGRKLGSYICPQ